MQPTAGLAPKWRFLTGGAFACLCSTSLARPVGAKSPRDTLFEVGVCNGEISTAHKVLLYPILDGFARHAWLGPRTTVRAKLTNADCAQATLIKSVP